MEPTRGAVDMVDEVDFTVCGVRLLPAGWEGNLLHVDRSRGRRARGVWGLGRRGRAPSLLLLLRGAVEVTRVGIVVVAVEAGVCDRVACTVSFAWVVPGGDL